MNVSQLHIQNMNWLVKHKNSIKQWQDVKEIFAHETADFKIACLQSAVSWSKNAGFRKFKIVVLFFDQTMEND